MHNRKEGEFISSLLSNDRDPDIRRFAITNNTQDPVFQTNTRLNHNNNSNPNHNNNSNPNHNSHTNQHPTHLLNAPLDSTLNFPTKTCPLLPGNKNGFRNHFHELEQQLQQYTKVTYLENKDFTTGTYRITTPGIYRLREDILLEPNRDSTCFPTQEQSKRFPMRPGPFILGFFAGITIETDNVILDLNGYTIKQSVRFYVLQRFFSTIELANSPFIPKPSGDTTQGPANFGLNFKAANNVIIRNGTLGLSSHHGIHGNGAKNILVENLTIRDFEVGGISLNGVRNVYLDKVCCKNSMGTSLKVPINGRFSAAVYLWRTLSLIVKGGLDDYYINIGKQRFYVSDAFFSLDKLIRETVDICERKNIFRVPKYPTEIFNLFGNPEGFQDCSAIYGFLFNKNGVAINEFGACDPNCDEAQHSSHILIEACHIENLVFKPREVVAQLKPDGKFQKDFSGSMIMVLDTPWFTETQDNLNRYNPERKFVTDGHYDLILATQVLLYKYSQDRKIKWAKGVSDISDNIIDWVSNGHKPFKCYNNIKTARNSDIMGHVMKGGVAIRLDFSSNISLYDNHIKTIINHGPPGINNDILQGYLDNEASQNTKDQYHHMGHPKSDDIDVGYTGNVTRGISLIKSNQVDIRSLDIIDLVSDNGSVYGIDLIQHNEAVDINRVHICNVKASLPTTYIPKSICFHLPNWIPRAIGILIRFSNKKCHATGNSSKNIRSLIISNSLVIESSSDHFGASVESQSDLNKERFQISDTAFDTRSTV